MSPSFFTTRRLWLLLAMGSGVLVVASVVLTSILKLHPCYLCVFQRLMFMLVTVFAVLAAVLRARLWSAIALALLMACAATGAGAAAYQVWLQAQPGAEFLCTGGGDPNLVEQLVIWLNTQVPVLFLATGNCASKELVILKLSLAEWSLVGFVTVLLIGALALWRGRSARA